MVHDGEKLVITTGVAHRFTSQYFPVGWAPRVLGKGYKHIMARPFAPDSKQAGFHVKGGASCRRREVPEQIGATIDVKADSKFSEVVCHNRVGWHPTS